MKIRGFSCVFLTLFDIRPRSSAVCPYLLRVGSWGGGFLRGVVIDVEHVGLAQRHFYTLNDTHGGMAVGLEANRKLLGLAALAGLALLALEKGREFVEAYHLVVDVGTGGAEPRDCAVLAACVVPTGWPIKM